jgi:hypothetical protein
MQIHTPTKGNTAPGGPDPVEIISRRIATARRALCAKEIHNFTVIIEGIDDKGASFLVHLRHDQDGPHFPRLQIDLHRLLQSMMDLDALEKLKHYPR